MMISLSVEIFISLLAHIPAIEMTQNVNQQQSI
jgi:hypothetical protein